jgi:acetyl-CoA acetyltransferase
MKRKKGSAVIAGVAMTKVTRELTRPFRDIAFDVVSRALEDAGIQKEDVDGLFVTPPGFAGPPSFMYVCELGEYLQLNTKSMAMLECGGTTSAVTLRYAIDEILLGRNRVNVVLAIDQRVNQVPDDINIFLHEGIFTQTCLYGAFDGPYGIGAPIPYYAMSTQRYLFEYGIKEEDLAHIAVRLRENASKNPYAEYRKPITIEDVMASKYLSPPIKLLDCSPFSSGAAACVLASDDVVKDLDINPIFIKSIGEYHHPSHFIPLRASINEFESLRRSAKEAFDNAGIKPNDVDIAEVYGVFTGTELMIYEDIGFFEKGKAINALKDGTTAIDGDVAINTSGGRLSLGHPASATPLMELVEVVWQLRGEAGERQVKNAHIGLVHAEHGMLNGSIVMILEN